MQQKFWHIADGHVSVKLCMLPYGKLTSDSGVGNHMARQELDEALLVEGDLVEGLGSCWSRLRSLFFFSKDGMLQARPFRLNVRLI